MPSVRISAVPCDGSSPADEPCAGPRCNRACAQVPLLSPL